MASTTTSTSHDDIKDELQPADGLDEVNNELKLELEKAQAAEDALDHTFTCLKEPGDRRTVTWNVASVIGLSVKDIMDVFKRPWLWGATVLGHKFKGKEITEWAFVGPEGREWALRATWVANKAIPEEKPVEWLLAGNDTNYDEFALWLGGRINKSITIVPQDDDCIPPRKVGVAETFWCVHHVKGPT